MSSHGARLVRGVLVTDFVVIRILVVPSSCSPSSLPSPVVKLLGEIKSECRGYRRAADAILFWPSKVLDAQFR